MGKYGIFPDSAWIDLNDLTALREVIAQDKSLLVRYPDATYAGQRIDARVKEWEDEVSAIRERLKPYIRKRVIMGGKR